MSFSSMVLLVSISACSIITPWYLALLIAPSVNDFVVIGKLEIDNTESFTYFNLTFRNEYAKEMCEDLVKDRFRYDEIPKGFMVINEIGIRSREFDNVKYFDYAGDLLFSNTWCE